MAVDCRGRNSGVRHDRAFSSSSRMIGLKTRSRYPIAEHERFCFRVWQMLAWLELLFDSKILPNARKGLAWKR